MKKKRFQPKTWLHQLHRVQELRKTYHQLPQQQHQIPDTIPDTRYIVRYEYVLEYLVCEYKIDKTDARGQLRSAIHQFNGSTYDTDGGRGTHVTDGRRRMPIDPCISTMPGRSTAGCHRGGSHCLHRTRGVPGVR